MTASKETVWAKMKEQPAQIKKSQVKIKVSTVCSFFVSKVCCVPNTAV